MLRYSALIECRVDGVKLTVDRGTNRLEQVTHLFANGAFDTLTP